MSKSRQQKVKNGKRRIKRRLRRKNWSQQDEPMFKANNIHYELSERTRGIGVGGIGAVHKLALASGLVEAIDEKVDLLKVHLPYHESDHVLNIAYNILSGGTCPSSPVKKSRFCSRRKFGGQVQGRCDSAERPS